jgi:hypothetical protein
MSLKDTIFFYSRNDYLIINSLLGGDMDHLWEMAEVVNGDSKAVLAAYADGTRKPHKKNIVRYKSRIYDCLDDNTKAKILETARQDIANIFGAMKPAKRQMLLYRTVFIIDDPLRPHNALPSCEVNDIVAFDIISSTSIAPYREDAGFDFYRYEITVPKHGLVLKLDRFNRNIRNEDGEVLLPPMNCRVTNIRGSDNEHCKKIIELEYLEKQEVYT